MAVNETSKFALKSVTILGLLILVLNHFLPDLPTVEIENISDAILKVGGAAMVLYGRWRKGDLKISP